MWRFQLNGRDWSGYHDRQGPYGGQGNAEEIGSMSKSVAVHS